MTKIQVYFPLVLIHIITSTNTNSLTLQTFNGQVGGGNYTYYKLTQDGIFILTLKSIEGDADLYVAQNNLYPTFDLDRHSLQSTTCGLDVVSIPQHLTRPVGIGIYGHPSAETSRYELQVHWHEDDQMDQVNDYEEISNNDFNSKIDPPVPTMSKDDDQSILWTILVGILKILLEILAS